MVRTPATLYIEEKELDTQKIMFKYNGITDYTVEYDQKQPPKKVFKGKNKSLTRVTTGNSSGKIKLGFK